MFFRSRGYVDNLIFNGVVDTIEYSIVLKKTKGAEGRNTLFVLKNSDGSKITALSNNMQ